MASLQASILTGPAADRFLAGIRASIQALMEKEVEMIQAEAQAKLDKAIKKVVTDTAIDLSRWVEVQHLNDRLVITIRDERKPNA